MNTLRIAATQFDLRPLRRPEEFWDRCEELTARAARERARMILFPEYFTLPWLMASKATTFEEALQKFNSLAEEFHRELAALSNGLHMGIVAGTVPVRIGDHLVNRCHVFLPDGRNFVQDKWHMTPAETDDWSIAHGPREKTVFDFEGARWGIAIGYDVEFPSYTASLIKEDVDFILVPSLSENLHAYWRVRHCAQARAVEGQCGVIMSSLVGGDSRHAEMQKCEGRAGFFTPCDLNMPEGGVLGLGSLNKENVHVAQYDLLAMHQIRVGGTVLNRRDQLADAF